MPVSTRRAAIPTPAADGPGERVLGCASVLRTCCSRGLHRTPESLTKKSGTPRRPTPTLDIFFPSTRSSAHRWSQPGHVCAFKWRSNRARFGLSRWYAVLQLAGVWHHRKALNGGQDGLVLLAGAERTAASCSAAQRGCFRILSDLQLHGIDELGFIHSTRADAVLLSRGVDEQRLMHAGAESALQARSGSRSSVS
jgi:hypothetical protein